MDNFSKWLNEISVLQYVLWLYGSIAAALAIVWVGHKAAIALARKEGEAPRPKPNPNTLVAHMTAKEMAADFVTIPPERFKEGE